MVRIKDTSIDSDSLLTAGPTLDRIALVSRIALSQHNPPSNCPVYTQILDKSLETQPPPFGTKEYSDIYNEASAIGQWMAISLMTNAEREGDGATRLWSLASCSNDEEEKQLLKEHAVDESRHALAYLSLLDLCFPNAVNPSFRSDLNQLSPHYSIKQEPFAVEDSPYARIPTIDDYMQMNIAEIRTTIHHLMQRKALKNHCPDENWGRATRILDSLLRDELKHVAYTAVLIEKKINDSNFDKYQTLFCKRMSDFNEITENELNQLIFE